MKIVSLILLVPLWLLSSGPALAQRPADPNWVFYLAGHGSHFTRDPQLLGAGSPLLKPGFSLGIARNIQFIPKTLGLHVGLRYTLLGYRSDARRDSVRRKSTANLSYVEVPADVVLQLGGERTKLYASAGPYVGMGFGGRRRYREENYIARPDTLTNRISYEKVNSGLIRFNLFDNQLKRLDYGLNLAVGFRRQYTAFGLTYKHGLADLNATGSGGSIFTRSYGLFLTYFFDDAF